MAGFIASEWIMTYHYSAPRLGSHVGSHVGSYYDRIRIAMGNLTEIQLRNLLRAGQPVAGVSDGDGLTFTLSAKGTAAWVLRYRYAGRRKEVSLGRYPDVSLADARKKATAYRVKVNEGVDVARQKQDEESERRAAGTMRELCDEFLTRGPGKDRRRPEKPRLLLDGNVTPFFGNQLARDVTDRQIIALLDRVRDGGTIAKKSRKGSTGPAPTIANHLLRLLKQVFRYGKERRYLDRNPAIDITVAAAGGKEKPRTRALDVKEIGEFLRAIQKAEIHAADKLALKIILATCVRLSELVKARWEHVDFEQGIWHLPATSTKTQEPIDIPMAPAVAEWFAELKRLACDSAWVLPARRIQKDRPTISPQTLDRALINVPHGLPRFVIHDLRRTARTQLAALGVSWDIAERCLNHKLQGVRGVYDRHDYLDERRDALEKWAAMLVRLAAGEAWNVVPLARGVA